MECCGKPVFNDFTGDEIKKIRISPPDWDVRRRVRENWDAIAKPIDGLGRFEELVARIGAISGEERIDIGRKTAVVFCADNGIVAEKVSQCGQEATAAIARACCGGRSAVCVMARSAGVDIIIVDIGIASDLPIPGLIQKKVRKGTQNFLQGPAMTEREAVKAISIGIGQAYRCREKGCRLLAAGEVGIGNTTTASAVAAALLGCGAGDVVGRGAGLDDEGLARKRRAVEMALERYCLSREDPLGVLATVGGLDIAGLAGLCIGGALCHIPVVLDGMISMAAALAAERLVPGVKEYLISSHMGREPAMELLSKELALEPVIYGDMALGEGTGAIMMCSLLDLAIAVYDGHLSFSDIGIAPYERRVI